MNLYLKQLIIQILSGLDSRQKDILESRYGLIKPERITLANIGEQYGITREGIRRIEEQALNNIKPNMKKEAYQQFIKFIIKYLRKNGGVCEENKLAEDISKIIKDKLPQGILINYLRFLLSVSKDIFYYKEDRDFNNYWYLDKKTQQQVLRYIDSIVADLKDNKTINFSKDSLNLNFIGISKKFTFNCYGIFGLAKARHIVPRSARDWAYLVLKKEERPMHFFELAKIINNLQKQPFHPQTIHNELIKHDIFVRIGKGIYGLRERGYISGNTQEVIDRLIKKHGPLLSQEVINLISQERFLKKNTILINLQNKKYFKRLIDGRYSTLA